MGIGKDDPDPPPTPNPAATAAAQGAANKETAIAQARLNQVAETTPYGKSYYKPTGEEFDGIQQFERITELAPTEQEALDKRRAITSRLLGIGEGQLDTIGQKFGSELDFSGLPSAPGGDADERRRIEDELYGSYTSRLDPRFETEQRRLETKLANQGITRGTEAWDRALDQFGRTKTDAYQQALAQAVASGGAEESRQFGLGRTARTDALTEMLTQRNQPINELSVLLGTSPQVSTPQFSPIPTTGIAPTDVLGATALSQSAAQNAYNQQMGADNSFMNSLFGLGGSLGSAGIMKYSDPDLKTDKRPLRDDDVLSKVETLPVESWRYKGGEDRHVGPYADDWAERFGGDGMAIDLGNMLGVNLAAVKALTDRVKRLEAA